jgi:hypothetical protein
MLEMFPMMWLILLIKIKIIQIIMISQKLYKKVIRIPLLLIYFKNKSDQEHNQQ